MSHAEGATLSYEDGARAVELAREAVDGFVRNGKREHPGSMRDALYLRTGAFIRLESTRGRGSLRGCAGRYDANEQLGHVIIETAIEAASDDSCGSAVTPTELSNLTISVCIVNEIEEPEQPLEALDLGTHGVALADDPDGWLYPTVPVNQHWSPREYLDRTCRKANLPPGAWQQDDVPVVLFDCQIFEEREPEGSVGEIK